MAALTGTIEDGLAFESLARFGFRPDPLFRGYLVRRSRNWGQPRHWLRHSQIAVRKDPLGDLLWTVNGLGVNGPTNESDLTTFIWLVLGETP